MNRTTQMTDVMPEKAKATFRHAMKGTVVSSGTILTPRGISVGRVRRSHMAISQRVSVNAVNTVVTMPMASVTAKPRIGPEPR